MDKPLINESECSSQISQKWERLRNYFYRSYLKNNFNNKVKIINEINDIKSMSLELRSNVLKIIA